MAFQTRLRAAAVAGLTLAMLSTGTATAQDQTVDEIAATFEKKLGLIETDLDDLKTRLEEPNLPKNQLQVIRNLKANLSRRAETLWQGTLDQIQPMFEKTREEILKFNEGARPLEFEAVVIGSYVDLLNNLGTFSTRTEFDQNVARFKKDWENNYGAHLRTFGADFDQERLAVFSKVKATYSIDLAALGYGRGGLPNPYVPAVFEKFFDRDNGSLIVKNWETEAKNWGKYRNAVETFRHRQQERRQVLEATSKGLIKLRNRILDARKKVGRDLQSL
jgi:hypothetical protein